MLCQFGEDERTIEKEYVTSKWEPYAQPVADKVNKDVQEKGGE